MTEELIQTIFSRRSIRKYTAESVSEADIKTLLEAAMAAPSASNNKPWHFVVVTERESLDALADAHPYGKMLAQAPLCIAVCGDPAISDYWEQDCSAATENLLVAVAALELGAVWLGVHPREDRVAAVQNVLGLPKKVTRPISIKRDGQGQVLEQHGGTQSIVPLNLISIGHPAEDKEPRTQYDEARVHRGHW